MSLTVAEIGNEICALANLPQLTQYVNNTSRNAQIVVNAIKDGARDVHRAFNWTAVTIRGTLNLTSQDSDYALPSDFDRYVQESMWDETNDNPVRGPMSVQQFEALESGTPNTGFIYYWWRIKRHTSDPTLLMAEFFPKPTGPYTVNYSYISKNYVSSSSTLYPKIQSDADTFIIDDQLVKLNATWRLLRKVGMNYVDEKMDYQFALQEREARDGGSKVLNLEGEQPKSMIGAAGIPQTGFGQ